MRGDTQASETFGAQNLKSKWGTQRLQKFQGEVQRYTRDCFRIIAELAAKNFGDKTIQSMCNLDFATDDQVAQAQQIMQMAQVMQMRMQAQAQMAPQQPSGGPPGQPPQPGQGGPPQPPQLPPELEQAMQQAQDTLSKLKWSDVIGMLREDTARQYRIDIETNSTIDPTRQEDKQDIIEVMQALANTAESFGPFVEQGVFPMPAFKSLLLAICRRFTFGREVEDEIEAIPDQVPATVNNTPDPAKQGGSQAAGPTPEMLQAKQIDGQNALAKAQAEQQLIPLRQQAEQQKTQNDMARQQREEQRAVLEHQLTIAELRAKVHAVEVTSAAKERDLAIGSEAKMRDGMIQSHFAREAGAVANQQAAERGAIANRQAAEGGQIRNDMAREAGGIANDRASQSAKIALKREKSRPAPGNGQRR
jgi:hypothetical protein